MTRKHIVTIIGLFSLWRMGLFLISAGAGFVLPYAPSFPYATTLLPSFDLPQWLYSFANFDGVHYLTIAKEGYLQTNFIQAFFPLYPFVLLHSVHLLLPSVNLLLMGLLVSHLAFLGFLILSFDFVERKYGVRVAWRFVLAVLLFPWSLFLASLYTESLFLFLVILCFWLADKKRWYLASLALMFLSATRIVGVMMIPALLIELWLSGDRDWKKYTAIIFGSLGLLGYMAYLFVHFQDPLYFLHVQEAFGAGRSNGITLYPQVAYRSLKILLTTAFNFKYITYVQEFLAGTIGVIAILIPWRRVSPGITFFALSTVLIPTISGSFLSMGRFLIPALPLYILMALFASKHPRLAWIWYIASALVLILNTLLFIQGYWIA